MSVPGWWEATLLALASWRTTRIVGWDSITEPLRELVVRKKRHSEGLYRRRIDVFVHCGWCLGFWVSLAWWAAWEAWPRGALVAAAPLAISTLVGFAVKTLDA